QPILDRTMFKSNRQPISEINNLPDSGPNPYSPLLKESTKIKNDKGYTAAIEFLESILQNCNSPRDTVRIAKRIIDFKQKIKGIRIEECIQYAQKKFIDGLDMAIPENAELLLKYSELLPMEKNISFL